MLSLARTSPRGCHPPWFRPRGRNPAQRDAIIYTLKLMNSISVFFGSDTDCLLPVRNQERCGSAEMPAGGWHHHLGGTQLTSGECSQLHQ